MKRVMCVFLVLVFAASLLYSGEAYAKQTGNMLDFFNERYVTKAYVSDIVNSSGDDRVDVEELKSEIEKALASRLSHTFKIVSEKAGADIVIDTEIVEYLWTDHDPVDMIITIPMVIIDVLKKDHYARMQVVFTVTDAKKGINLWSERLQSTLTGKDMSEEESYDLSNKRIVKIFIRKLFKKPERR